MKNILLILAVVLLTAGGFKADMVLPPDAAAVIENPDDYILYVTEQAGIIEASLEHDVLTQTDMNMKSQQLCELWDEALDFLLEELAVALPEEEFAELQAEQQLWLAEKEKLVEEAGKPFEGGSLYALIANSEAAKLTEERVHELYGCLKETD